MRSRFFSLFLAAAAVLATAVTSGCADFSAVRRYADDTQKLSEAFEPMLEGSVTSCTEKFNRKKMIASRSFDATTAEQAADQLCAPIRQDNRVIGDINLLLDQYGQTLDALAQDNPAPYKKELDKLKESLGTLKRADTGQRLVSAEQAGAITALTDFLSRVATQQMKRSALRDLIGHEAAVQALTQALKDYATLNYRGWLRDGKNDIAILRKFLEEASKTEPLAAHYIEAQLRLQERQIESRDRTVDALVRSIDALQKSHTALRLKLDTLSDKELAKQLAEFTRQVFNLRKQVRNAF